MVKCEILENGEQALFYNYNGKVSLKEGPKRVIHTCTQSSFNNFNN